MTTPPSDDNPFRTPDYATQHTPMPPVPGQPAIPHWFTVKVRITLAVCVVLALALGSLAALGLNSLDGSGTPSDGDCLYLTREGGDRTAYHRVGCGSDSATYKVERAYSGSLSCSSNGYVRFKTTTGSGAGRTLCLALNVRTGDCLRDIDDEVRVAKVSCSDPSATERAEVLTGSRDRTDCEGADDIRFYSGPPARVVCLAPPGENI
ncbi:LppU/SCO3897 family protein [Amycolatopsis lexingtonensis]|uniref:LppU/SCO3897 family protein n=1 Tax=Amycolatopsis lexingtonensis TaxID=218822 RepID=UPI003F70BF3F